jgi:signal transduction histidine kinase
MSHPPTELYRRDHDHLTRINVADTGNVFCAPDDSVYAQADGITRVLNGRVERVPLLPGIDGYGENYIFTGLLPMPDEGLIAAASGTATGKALWIYKNHQWSRYLPTQTFPGEVTAMFVDTRHTIYLGHNTGDVSVVRGESFHTLRTGSSQFQGVLGFAETSYGVFAHGSQGVALVGPDRSQVITFANQEYSKAVTGLVQAQNGDIWLNSFDGIVRVQAAELRAALADPSHAISAANLQEADFKGPGMPLLFSSTAHIDKNGTLWFSTLNGVISVDPIHLRSPEPPHVIIRSVTADGAMPDARGEFPPQVSTLDVRYFGVNLRNPEGVVYRYRLDGVDGGWEDAGHRTDAIYTRLRPGRYVFRVMASNGDGIWTDAVTSAPFTIRPSFYQTWWFVTLSSLTGVAIVWFVICSRFRSISHEVRLRAEERADERIRIARDLHDTLLQGIQGLLLNFHVAAQKVPPDHESRSALEKALAMADRIILEGRNRVTRLRSDHLTDAELTPSLECFANDLNVDGAVHFVVERQGGAERLENQVVDEVFSIAREAMTNAFRHAHASRVVVELDYGTREFRMSCRDNGRGFDVAGVFGEATNGHFGLPGMAERARNIGGTLSWRSRPQEGTEVSVALSARRAYARVTRFRRWLRRDTAQN